jgi:hypothetical protein
MLKDRIKETVTGTGPFTPTGAEEGAVAFGTAYAAGEVFPLVVEHGGDWACGYGHLTAGGDIAFSAVTNGSNAGGEPAWTAGEKTAYVAAHVNVLTGGVVDVASSLSVSPAHGGKMLRCAGSGITLTLPDATLLANGWRVHLRNTGAETVTLAPVSGQLIDGLDGGGVLAAGASGELVCDGAGWVTLYHSTGKTGQQSVEVVGIAQVSTGGGGGSWARVDADGNDKATDAAYWNNHPVIGAITDVTVDGQAMVQIPKFYYKVGAAPAGSAHAGQKCWWVTDQPMTGFTLHPAFMDGGTEIDHVYVGKYQGANDGGTKLGSVAGTTPLVSIDFPTMQSRANARNTGGVSGFRLWSIYELAAIQMLALIEVGGADMQALIGQGRVSASSAANVDASDVAQATWRGIVGLWGNVWQMCDGLKLQDGQLRVWDRQGNRTWVDTGVTVQSSGWVVSVLDQAGSGWDFRDLFVAASTNGTEGNGTFGDYQYSSATAERVCCSGGYWSRGSNAGLFYLHLYHAPSYSSTSLGGRLAKV